MRIHKNMFSHLWKNHKTLLNIHTKNNNNNPTTNHNQKDTLMHCNHNWDKEKNKLQYRHPPITDYRGTKRSPQADDTTMRVALEAVNKAVKLYRWNTQIYSKTSFYHQASLQIWRSLVPKSSSFFYRAIRKVGNRSGLLCALRGRPIKALRSTTPTLYYILGLVC